MIPKKIPANYIYWQEHGCDWYGEYDQRKKHIVYYHIQELMLADYFHHSSPAKVLEFGCGIGRHLSYLSKIPGIEVYGYDQSKTMVDGCLEWANEKWVDEHIFVGKPLQKLPYPDHFFDFVFTAEVLVHIRPEDIKDILSELVRVSKWQILHLETAAEYELVENAHDGCWYHDLIQCYRDIGYLCQLITKGYRAHSPYRVILNADRQPFTWSNTILLKFHELEDKIQETISFNLTAKTDLENKINQLEDSIRIMEEEKRVLEKTVDNLKEGQVHLSHQFNQEKKALIEEIALLSVTINEIKDTIRFSG